MYFSDRERGAPPRTQEEIDARIWGGIAAAINARIKDGSFGARFAAECPDGQGTWGCDGGLMGATAVAEIPGLNWPLRSDVLPEVMVVLDLIEFCHESVGKPERDDFHPYFGHHHLNFDMDQGRVDFREAINRLFARNGLVFSLEDDGQIRRLAPPVLGAAIDGWRVYTHDGDLDRLIQTAVAKFAQPELEVRVESLEKLWDAWERLKSMDTPGNKAASVQAMIDRTACRANHRAFLTADARALTEIGNGFRIRHSEVDKIPIERHQDVDYLFHRLFAMIRLVLVSTGRGT